MRSLQIQRISEDVRKAPVIDITEKDMVRSYFLVVEEKSHDTQVTRGSEAGCSAPVLGLNVKMFDSQTFSKEFSEEYLDLSIKHLRQSDLINFSLLLQTNRDQWGGVLTQFDFLIYERAIAKLLKLSREEMWKTFESVTGYRRSDY